MLGHRFYRQQYPAYGQPNNILPFLLPIRIESINAENFHIRCDQSVILSKNFLLYFSPAITIIFVFFMVQYDWIVASGTGTEPFLHINNFVWRNGDIASSDVVAFHAWRTFELMPSTIVMDNPNTIAHSIVGFTPLYYSCSMYRLPFICLYSYSIAFEDGFGPKFFLRGESYVIDPFLLQPDIFSFELVKSSYNESCDLLRMSSSGSRGLVVVRDQHREIDRIEFYCPHDAHDFHSTVEFSSCSDPIYFHKRVHDVTLNGDGDISVILLSDGAVFWSSLDNPHGFFAAPTDYSFDIHKSSTLSASFDGQYVALTDKNGVHLSTTYGKTWENSLIQPGYACDALIVNDGLYIYASIMRQVNNKKFYDVYGNQNRAIGLEKINDISALSYSPKLYADYEGTLLTTMPRVERPTKIVVNITSLHSYFLESIVGDISTPMSYIYMQFGWTVLTSDWVAFLMTSSNRVFFIFVFAWFLLITLCFSLAWYAPYFKPPLVEDDNGVFFHDVDSIAATSIGSSSASTTSPDIPHAEGEADDLTVVNTYQEMV